MPRFSISVAMALIALAAANCAVLRAVSLDGGESAIFVLGLLPLLNAQIIGLYCLIAPRYRISLRRRTPPERLGFAPVFAAVNGLVLLAIITAYFMAPEAVMAYLAYVEAPIGALFDSLGIHDTDYDKPLIRFVVIPLNIGAAISGPPLVLAAMFSWVLSRYKLVIVSRRREVPPAAQAAAEPGETQSDG